MDCCTDRQVLKKIEHNYAEFLKGFNWKCVIVNLKNIFQIYKANKARQTMTISQRREINATQTFCIVSIILLLCHGVAMAIFVTSQVYRELSRELQFCQILSVTFNASVNFLIYYALGKSFRDEFWKLTRACKLFRTKVELAAVTPSSSVNGTVEVGLSSVKVKSLRQLNSIPQSQRAYNTNEITNSSVKWWFLCVNELLYHHEESEKREFLILWGLSRLHG